MLLGILNVLKVIGIILLVVLGIIIMVLLLVLFVPLRYRLDFNVPETDLDQGVDIDKIYLSARFSWLLHAVRGGIEFPENKEFYLKVLWISILPSKKKAEKDINDKNIAADKLDEKTSSDGDQSDSPKDSALENTENASDNFEEDAVSEDYPDEDKNLIEIFSDILDKIENILKTPQNVFEKIQYTISRVCDKIGMIKRTIDNDIFKRAFQLVKAKMIRIIKMILPDKCDVDILFGTGDPADTASVMAAYGALYPILYNKVRYRPDFERKVVFAEGHLKGHITSFTIIYCVLRCYFDKDVKKVIRRFKKIMKS